LPSSNALATNLAFAKSSFQAAQVLVANVARRAREQETNFMIERLCLLDLLIRLFYENVETRKVKSERGLKVLLIKSE
jgi:hypothetical protein